MRNIYDIIKEQKAVVDVNIASYELDHIICSFSNNDYYLQEGIGDTIKNAAHKVVEFIKAVINKLRELIKKIIDHISVRKPKVTMADLKNAKVGDENKEDKDEKTDNTNDEKVNNVYDKNMHKGKDPDSISEQDILRGSLRTVNMIKYVGFDIKKQITETFLGQIDSVTRNHIENYAEAGKLFINSIERTCFKGAGSFKKVKGISIAERIQLEIGEPKEPVQIKVSDIDIKVLESYIMEDMKYGAENIEAKGKGLKKFFKNVENETTKNLNELKAKLEGLNNDGGNVNEQSFANIQKVVGLVSSFMNFITVNVFKAYNTLLSVFEQALMDYARAYNVRF